MHRTISSSKYHKVKLNLRNNTFTDRRTDGYERHNMHNMKCIFFQNVCVEKNKLMLIPDF